MNARTLVLLALLVGVALAAKEKKDKDKKGKEDKAGEKAAKAAAKAAKETKQIKETKQTRAERDPQEKGPGRIEDWRKAKTGALTEGISNTDVTALEEEMKNGKRKYVNDGYPLKSGDIGITVGEVERYVRLLSSVGITDAEQLEIVYNLLLDLQEALQQVKEDPTKVKLPFHNEILVFISLLHNGMTVEGFVLSLQRDLARRTQEFMEIAEDMQARTCKLEFEHLKTLVQYACPGNTVALMHQYSWILKNCKNIHGLQGKD